MVRKDEGEEMGLRPAQAGFEGRLLNVWERVTQSDMAIDKMLLKKFFLMLCNIAEDGKCLNQTHAWEFMILDLFLDAREP